MKLPFLILSIGLSAVLAKHNSLPSYINSHHSTLSPKDMLALPRASGVIPSPDGKFGVEIVSEHDFSKRKTKKKMLLIPLTLSKSSPKQTTLLTSSSDSSFSEPIWISHHTIAYLNTTKGENPQFWGLNLSSHLSSHKHGVDHLEPEYVLTFPTTPSSLKYLPPKHAAKNAGTEGVLSFSAHVWKGRGIEEVKKLDEEWEEKGDSGMMWDELFIREWDTWRNPEKVHQVFLTPLSFAKGVRSTPTFIAPFNSSSIWSKMNPFSLTDYDIAWSPSSSIPTIQLVVQIKDPHLNDAFHTRRVVYYTSLPLSSLSSSSFDGKVTPLTPGEQGAISSLSFSPDGRKVAWAEMRLDGSEADRNRVVSVDIGERKRVEWTEGWDRSPSAIIWSYDSKSLYFLSENLGSVLPYHLSHPEHLPTPLLFNGSTSSLVPLSSSRLLIQKSSLVSPPESYILTIPEVASDVMNDQDGDGDKIPDTTLEQVTIHSEKGLKGKHLSPGEKFWFKGTEGKDVMGWIVKPKGWKEGEKKRWPMAFLIHGGPEASWEDSWSTRWNPSVFAQQGYFTVAINPTGSTGYGQDFVTGIQQNWGGRPFKDLVAGLQYILATHPEIDGDRLAALGGSYGGYMVNWLQGHNEQTKFKAFVCHDGLFETHMMYYVTDEVYFLQQEMGGLAPYQDRYSYEKWSPANFIAEWSTPTLIVQGGTDYRVPEYHSVAAFTALQHRGVPSRFLYFPEENHWVLNPQNSMRWHHEVLRWLDEWVGESSLKTDSVGKEAGSSSFEELHVQTV